MEQIINDTYHESIRFEKVDVSDNLLIGRDVNIRCINKKADTNIFIGRNCVIESGTLIEGNNIYIGDDVHIGTNCRISGDNIRIDNNCLIYDDVFIVVKNFFRLGTRCKISKNCVYRCNSINIGNDLWCNENVDIGGGGCWQEAAQLEIGDFVHIGKNAMINVCKPVHIGSRTGIGIESMIFTHSAGNGQSILKGYYHVEKEVWIGDNVSLYTRAFVTPGSKIQNGAIVGASSYVSGLVRKGLYVGTPAQMKKEIKEPDTETKKALILSIVEREFGKTTTIFDNHNIITPKADRAIIVWDEIKKSQMMEFLNKIKRDYSETIIIKMNNNIEFTTGSEPTTIISIEEENICGVSTTFTERIRDVFRREGIILAYKDYIPSPLNYYDLKNRGIER